ncbi:fibrous sheath CABYR-binding protein isoform X3 [Schistocerca piceifrons]|uniref:fibrous sheath CABYR-binding protein isoform X3 n=1 Tax=Schistocerca piceifrons TaxID=274613 RepID=UPI001F5EF173|nr:fibrous sheath CABYR-binding protein isoform X3 [Schistocerca piceifrons]
MLPIDIWPTWVMSIGVVVPLVAALAVCICGCRKTVPKPASANRSLPDIPVDSDRSQVESRLPLWEQEPNGDTSSELYATVGENKNVTHPLLARPLPQNDAPTTSQQETLAETAERNLQPADSFPSYATVKSEHPYDKLKSNEHPYAQVGSSVQNTSGRAVELRHEEHVRNASSVPPAQIESEPIPPPRTRRAVSLNPPPVEQASHEIPAAPAIMGHIHANQDLPYMTPPIPGFSGDSQDSKGYTSISVREPLAKIKAQTKAANQRSRTQELVDSHYATVSDDSDEMYAAIEDPGMEYTSGSDTYAQIQTTVPEVIPAPAPVVDPEEINPASSAFPPQPPSVDSLRHVAQAHSRQASTSSATSSVINLGSPKPEKRQANSPLPPPPVGSPELRYTVPVTSLEEMYAKVMKKKHKSASQVETPTELAGLPQQSGDTSLLAEATAINECITQIEPISDSFGTVTTSKAVPVEETSSSDLCALPQVQTEIQNESAVYEHLPKQGNFKEQEPGYESVGPNSLVMPYDPGYEVVHQVQRNPSDCDPNYEQLRPQRKTDSHQYNTDNREEGGMKHEYKGTDSGQKRTDLHTGFTSVNLPEMTLTTDEPNYESMTSDTHEPNYAVVSGTSGGESDSAYEVVHQDDPNYESVNYFDVNSVEPPYERLHNEEARDSDSETVSGYEKVKLHCNSSLSTSQSEQISNYVSQQNAEPGYEEVRHTSSTAVDNGSSNNDYGSSANSNIDIYARITKS